MLNTHSFFLFLLLVILLPTAYGATSMGTVVVLEEGQIGGNNEDEVILDNNSTFDVSASVKTVDETTESIGGVEVDLTKEVEFIATAGDTVKLINTALPTVTVEIPDETVVSGPTNWDNTITPPKSISTTGTITGNFLTPTSAILVGSPDVILIFDSPVTLLLTGVTSTTAYKTPGSTAWIIISGCTGTYDAPNNPPANGECSISNGIDTKILTFHFTEFTGLSTPAPSTTAPTSSSSGGHGNTGVGSPRVFGGSSGGGTYYPPSQSGKAVPAWFDNVKHWYKEGHISATEFLNCYNWIASNILK